jgi:hypothetical protein
MNALTDLQREILAKLCQLAEMIESHKATFYQLEHERLRLQTELRQTGYRPGQPDQAALL